MRLAVGHQHARQQPGSQRGQGGHRHLALLGAGDAADGRDRVAKRHLQGRGLLQEDLARRRQAHGARGAVEQPHAQRLFDTLDLGGKRRLRQVQLRGRLPEIERAPQHQRGVDIAHRKIDLHAGLPVSIDLF
ncbi:hypothetical protein G6F65_019083 [Rhizopus arrhizus]|nr:hypothetical protein G6F68_016089 [Rhizopus microsporus]KAG1249577.1 hypothetical protein G6F65_019083 [Rhizopus arrhizus]